MYSYDAKSLYFAKDLIGQLETQITEKLEFYNVYMPKHKLVKVEELEATYESIRGEIKEALEPHIIKIDQEFAVVNYKYAIDQISHDGINQIYKILGPFDFYTTGEMSKDDEEGDLKFIMQESFRVSQASKNKYRGEVHPETNHAEGRGFKVFGTGGLYEGYFDDNEMHGYGRGISSEGNCYEGTFEHNVMHGYGIYFDAKAQKRYEG